jgi:sensor histidine kinase regulating citrate/malate metabolism
MDWTTVIFLGMSMVSLVLLMAVIIFGTRKSSEMKEFEEKLGNKTGELDSNNQELWEALKESKANNAQLVERLQNLEAIVISEAWDAIRKGEDEQNIELHLDEEPEELDDADKAAKIAKRIR